MTARSRGSGPAGRGAAEGPRPSMASGGGGGAGGGAGGGGKIRTRRYHLGAAKPPYGRSRQVRRGEERRSGAAPLSVPTCEAAGGGGPGAGGPFCSPRCRRRDRRESGAAAERPRRPAGGRGEGSGPFLPLAARPALRVRPGAPRWGAGGGGKQRPRGYGPSGRPEARAGILPVPAARGLRGAFLTCSRAWSWPCGRTSRPFISNASDGAG